MPQVEAAQAALDVRDGHSQGAPHRRAEHRRHRVAVNEDERPAGPGAQRLPERPPVARERPRHAPEPARDVGVRAQVAPTGSAREPDVGLAEAELVEKRRDLLHLLPGRREQVAVAALVEPKQHRSELDQLAGRPEDDEDHACAAARRRRSRSQSPRHMPAPWASA
jgi:hypothetical protein